MGRTAVLTALRNLLQELRMPVGVSPVDPKSASAFWKFAAAALVVAWVLTLLQWDGADSRRAKLADKHCDYLKSFGRAYVDRFPLIRFPGAATTGEQLLAWGHRLVQIRESDAAIARVMQEALDLQAGIDAVCGGLRG